MTQRHNKVRDSLGDIASLVYNDVLREVNEPRGTEALIADLEH